MPTGDPFPYDDRTLPWWYGIRTPDVSGPSDRLPAYQYAERTKAIERLAAAIEKLAGKK